MNANIKQSPKVVSLEILDGHSFRRMLDCQREATTVLPFIFKEDGFSTVVGNKDNSKIYQVLFNTENLLSYNVDPQYFNDITETGSKHVLCVELSLLTTFAKSVGKESVTLVNYADEPNTVHIFKNNDPSSSVKIECKEDYGYLDYEFRQMKKEPSFKLSQKEFCKALSDAMRTKPKGTTLSVYPCGVNMHVEGSSPSLSFSKKWGTINPSKTITTENGILEIEGEACQSIFIEKAIMKGMIKLNNTGPNTPVKIYCEENVKGKKEVFRIEFLIGVYAKLTICRIVSK